MTYFILTVGEYEDEDPIYLTSDLENIKMAVVNCLKNWYDNGCKYLETPNSIRVIKENLLYEHWEPERFRIELDNMEKIDKLFKDIEACIEENN